MKLSLRIPLTLTVIVVMGIVAFVKMKAQAGQFPTPYFIIWIVVSVILIGITVWSWLRSNPIWILNLPLAYVYYIAATEEVKRR